MSTAQWELRWPIGPRSSSWELWDPLRALTLIRCVICPKLRKGLNL